ncbi:MAG TPA: hypothetical protein P5250_03610, partial [Bacteroidales bacterium]|nr:hypothetical protein [Bacteroidales bacterium]
MNSYCKRFFLIVFFISAFCYFNWASISDTSLQVVDSNAVYIYKIKDLDNFGFYKYKYIDTSIVEFQFNDPAYKESYFYTSLGNIGTMERKLFFEVPDLSFFTAGNHYVNLYSFNPDNVDNYVCKRPFTELYYSMGSRREQIFKIAQSLPLKKNFYIGANYLIVNSNGRELFRQKSANDYLSINSKYFTKNKKYLLHIFYICNKIKFQENGGITNDSIFENRTDKKENPPYYLNSAETRYKETYLAVSQYFNYTNKILFSEIDSSFSMIERNKINIKHDFTYKRSFRVYEDNQPFSGYYPNVFYNTEQTFDSSFFSSLNNSLKISSTFIKIDSINDLFKINLIVSHQFTKWHTQTVDTIFNSFQPECNLQFSPLSTLLFKVNYKFQVGGYNNKGYQVDFSSIKILKEKNLLEFNVKLLTQEPAWIYNYYNSNNFIWDYHYLKQKFTNASLSYTSLKTNFGISLTNIKRMVYFDVLARPKQLNISTNILSIWLYSKFYYKNIIFANKILFNYAYHVDVLRYPLLQDIVE